MPAAKHTPSGQIYRQRSICSALEPKNVTTLTAWRRLRASGLGPWHRQDGIDILIAPWQFSSHMLGFIEALRRDARVSVSDAEEAWAVRIPKSELVIEVTIPRDVLEWFVTATDSDGHELWRDWTDYNATSGETREQLAAVMERDLRWFMEQAATQTVRVSRSGGRNTLEWQVGGGWRQISLCGEVYPVTGASTARTRQSRLRG